jgi:hypothetical protein
MAPTATGQPVGTLDCASVAPLSVADGGHARGRPGLAASPWAKCVLLSTPSPPVQVVSVFSSFGFQWPVQLTKLFAASSMSTFNEQLMAPECSIGAWSFELKCVPC